MHCSDTLRWKNGRLYLVGWAEAVAGPPEFDAAFFIESIAVESSLDPETILEWYRQIHPPDPEVMEAAIGVAAAFFADRAWLPELPGLPRLRTFQRRQLQMTLSWALRRLGLETPTWLAGGGRGCRRAKAGCAAFIEDKMMVTRRGPYPGRFVQVG